MGAAISGYDEVIGDRLFKCRPFGRYVTNNGKPMPWICEFKICPQCVARMVQIVYDTVVPLTNAGLTRIWTFTDKLSTDIPSQIKEMRDFMSYKVGKRYGLQGLTFARLMHVKGKWLIGLNVLVTHAVPDRDRIIIAKDLDHKHDYVPNTKEALLKFMPGILGIQPFLCDVNNAQEALWYLEITHKLHTVRGIGGIKLAYNLND